MIRSGIVQLIVSIFVSSVLANYGDVRIHNRNGGFGGKSGRLEFQDLNGTWGTVCNTGFDRDAADVVCKQLGYRQSSDVLRDGVFNNLPTNLPISICYTFCVGYEHQLLDCVLTTDCGSGVCSHYDDVGVTCTNLTAGIIVGITLGAFFCVIFIVTMITLCVCCLHPKCSCYYRNRRSYAVLVSQPREVYTVTTTSRQQFPPPSYAPAGYQTIPPSAKQYKL